MFRVQLLKFISIFCNSFLFFQKQLPSIIKYLSWQTVTLKPTKMFFEFCPLLVEFFFIFFNLYCPFHYIDRKFCVLIIWKYLCPQLLFFEYFFLPLIIFFLLLLFFISFIFQRNFYKYLLIEHLLYIKKHTG